jgi:hypothetical protein
MFFAQMRHGHRSEHFCEKPHDCWLLMEALTAVQSGLLTIYDMCKAVDRGDGPDRCAGAGEAWREERGLDRRY